MKWYWYNVIQARFRRNVKFQAAADEIWAENHFSSKWFIEKIFIMKVKTNLTFLQSNNVKKELEEFTLAVSCGWNGDLGKSQLCVYIPGNIVQAQNVIYKHNNRINDKKSTLSL